LSAGAKKLVFITGASKRAIADHFDADHELEEELERQGKEELLKLLRGIIPSWATCIYTRQSSPLGLGHAVLCAAPIVGDAPFFVHLADDLIDADASCLKQMAQVFEQRQASVLGVETVPQSETDKYGIVAVDGREGRVSQVKLIVEKPRPSNAPSNLAVVGRYILSGTIFDKLRRTGRGAGGEIQLTDAIADLLQDEPVFAYEFQGKRYDCGSKLGYLQATVEYGLKHESLGEGFSQYLLKLADQLREKK
jgi:UTP--glucose-1-phosphate uridylyltransferase